MERDGRGHTCAYQHSMVSLAGLPFPPFPATLPHVTAHPISKSKGTTLLPSTVEEQSHHEKTRVEASEPPPPEPRPRDAWAESTCSHGHAHRNKHAFRGSSVWSEEL